MQKQEIGIMRRKTMAKVGVSIKIDVSKIDKSRLFKGEKGTYLDLTTFINTSEKDQYGNHGFISQSTTKEERDKGVKTPILGNCKVFYANVDASAMQGEQFGGHQQAPQQQAPQQAPANSFDDFDQDIPFS